LAGGCFAYQKHPHKGIGTADKRPAAVTVVAKDASSELWLEISSLKPEESADITGISCRCGTTFEAEDKGNRKCHTTYISAYEKAGRR
jgi:hypothetical protein